ncbi:hypothetical protein OESDEN_19625 [Oesophagostomum dentatum]|uniref:Histidine acid phosphatase n=1 Tax=Oesophagostomum dentatum TaxID=61180 RepID=A0A0B1S9Y7_OESDE|nr:hypothetical protein OESDEN_19625 [Oesophagostomum dentatum]
MIDAQNDTAGRYHAELLLSYIEDHINRPLERKNKAVFVSGHDTNLMALGRHLNITSLANKLLPYSALLAIELHLRNGTYTVEMYLSETLQDQLKPVESLYCRNPCKLEDLQALLRDTRLSRNDWTYMCNGYGYTPRLHFLLVGGY